MKLQNFRKLGKNVKLSKKRTLPISGQNLFPQWCPLIRDYTVHTFRRDLESNHVVHRQRCGGQSMKFSFKDFIVNVNEYTVKLQ